MNSASSRISNWLVPAAIILSSIIIYSTPVRDGDAFWHIAAGRWMVENFSLIQKDPFSYMTYAAPLSAEELNRVSFVLRQYWLAQSILYWVWKSGGFAAIVVLRSVWYALALCIVWFWTQRRSDRVTALLLLLVAAPVLTWFPSERPQIFSFVFIQLLLWGLDEADRSGEDRRFPGPVLALPLLMLFWSNMHGSFILGWLLIFPYLAFAIHRRNKRAILVLAASLLTAMMNPFGITVLKTLFSVSSTTIDTNLEFLSPFRAAKDLGYYFPTFWVGAVWLAVSVIARFSCLRFAALPASAGLLFLALTGLRFIPLFVLTLPLLSEQMRIPKKACSVVLGIILIVVGGVNIDLRDIGKYREDAIYPEQAVEFLKAADTPERIFNNFEWGGYLQLMLPGRQVFSDGRILVESQGLIYDNIIAANGWEKEFAKYGIATAVIPAVSNVTGQTYPLAEALYFSPQWTLAYADGSGLVFVKTDAFSSGRSFVPPDRSAYFRHILQLTDKLPREAKNNAEWWVSRGNAHFQLGDMKSAGTSYREALKREPGHRWAQLMIGRTGYTGK